MKIRMTLFFPDVNVWVALSVGRHAHNKVAWNWLKSLPADGRLILCRPTQLGILRLLTNQSVMGDYVKTLKEAWAVYDQWKEDPRVLFFQEPGSLDNGFRQATAPLGKQAASKLVADCYLLAFASGCDATLVTFDGGLRSLAKRLNLAAVAP